MKGIFGLFLMAVAVVCQAQQYRMERVCDANGCRYVGVPVQHQASPPDGWYSIQPVRRSGQMGLLSEMLDRMPANYAASYVDGVGSPGHYASHGLSAMLRNGHGRSTSTHQACYVPGGRAWIGRHPRGVTLADLARTVNPSTPGYQTYLIQSQRYWNNQPLFILDELTAYSNSLMVMIERGEHRSDPSAAQSDLNYAKTMLVWSHQLVALAEARGNDMTSLRSFLSWMGSYVTYLERRVRT